MNTIEYILSRLDRVSPAGADQWTACCPAHEDCMPSLSIADSGGNVLLHCHAGCDVREICEALGLKLRDLFANDAPVRANDDEYKRDMAARLRAREAFKSAQYDHVMRRARTMWRGSEAANPEHPYLVEKCVPPLGLRQRSYHLLVPIVYRGLLVNLQRIAGNGSKVFLKQGRITGCYSPIGKIEDGRPLYLCEGWATGASIHRQKLTPVACAMISGNLFAAGDELKRQYPNVRLIIAGDDDRKKAKNPGRAAALNAANALQCEVIFPEWPQDAPANLSDFNDLAKWSFENVGRDTFCG